MICQNCNRELTIKDFYGVRPSLWVWMCPDCGWEKSEIVGDV